MTMLTVWLISILIFLDLFVGALCYTVAHAYQANSARIFHSHR